MLYGPVAVCYCSFLSGTEDNAAQSATLFPTEQDKSAADASLPYRTGITLPVDESSSEVTWVILPVVDVLLEV